MADQSNISRAVFDALAAWRSLDRAEQDYLGSQALDLVVARGIAESGRGPASRAGREAERLAHERLISTVLDRGMVADELWVEEAPAGGPFTEIYKLPALIAQVCLSCGCSDHDPCEEGCGWHDEETCTACAQVEAARG